MVKKIRVSEVVASGSVDFGTSGVRGLVSAMTDEVCYAYTTAFIEHMETLNEHLPAALAVGGDLRPSTDRILTAVIKAAKDKGYPVVDCGKLPTPALVHYGIAQRAPTMMVTGSHIPDDRNGIKFHRATGEINKSDELAIKDIEITIPDGLFNSDGMFRDEQPGTTVNTQAIKDYIGRYTGYFGHGCLEGKRIGLYEHSSVAREVLADILTAMGASVIHFGRSERFVSVDTEAIRQEDIDLGKQFARQHAVDCIVSADGDGDRPLVSTEDGDWLRGDIAGLLCASYLKASAVVTPVSSNTALERSGRFEHILRTRIGSPYVIAGMEMLSAQGVERVIGYEANGGVLLGSDMARGPCRLNALPTRDAAIVIVSVILLASEEKKSLSQLVAGLPKRFTASDRLKEFAPAWAQAKLAELYSGDLERDKGAIEAVFFGVCGAVSDTETTDGLRITFTNGEIIHLRPSGNAPEFRCYSEAASAARAREINRACMGIMQDWRREYT